MWWAVGAGAVVLSLLVWQFRGIEIRGRVSLQSWDGTLLVPQPARAMVFPRNSLLAQVRRHAAELPAARARAAAAVENEREAWRRKSAAREEALRILRVAERANAADLAACRERHAAAEQAADESFAELERRTRQAEALADPANVLVSLHGAAEEVRVGEDGRFVLRARVFDEPVVVVLAGGEGAGPLQAWLQAARAPLGGFVELDFTNANLLTEDGLRAFLGVPPPRSPPLSVGRGESS